MAKMYIEELQKQLEDANKTIASYRQRYQEGMRVVYTGKDESDDICCPSCGNSVARNDDYEEMRPLHCPDCGTRLLY